MVIFDAYRSRSKFAQAVDSFTAAIETGDLSHDGDPVPASHLGNARRADTKLATEDGQPLYLIRKERSDSPNTIDAAVAAILAWEARAACTAAGITVTTIRPGPIASPSPVAPGPDGAIRSDVRPRLGKEDVGPDRVSQRRGSAPSRL